MRWAAKRDSNEPEIVKALECAGWLVMKVSDKGAPDLLCAKNGRLVLVEVKGPKGKLTPAQVESHQRLAASGVTVHVVTTPEEALMAVGAPVEGVLEPLAKARRIGEALVVDARENATAKDVAAAINTAPTPMKASTRGNMLTLTSRNPSPRHVVTPAFQREQTEAVIPKRRTK